MPERWLTGVVTCQDKNSDHQYCHWTDAEIDAFVAAVYPAFVGIFRRYPYPIQRADAARYLILHRYGGVYVDLDIECRVSFTSILSTIDYTRRRRRRRSGGAGGDVGTPPIAMPTAGFETVLAVAQPTGVVGDFIASQRRSPFLRHVVAGLPEAAASRWYRVMPYLTVMTSTGPWYLSGRLSSHCRCSFVGSGAGGCDRLYVLSADLYGHIYFHHLAGASWHRLDGRVIWFLFSRRRRISFVLLCVAGGCLCLPVLLWYRRSRCSLSARVSK